MRLAAIALAAAFAAPVAAQQLGPDEVSRLILNEQGGVRDARGWGADILGAISDNRLPVNNENVCAVVAVVSQESGFKENPAVPGLGKIAEAEVRKRASVVPFLGAKAVDYLGTIPTPQNSFLKRIRNAKTERDLDLTYRDFVEYGAKGVALDGLLKTGLLDKTVEEYNQIGTVGSMQVSVAFALDTERGEHWRPISHSEAVAVRDKLYTRRGGLFYGVKQLLDYQTGYPQKLFRFADYNAGRYAARNAAFQMQIARLSGMKIDHDGDLLSYNKNKSPKGDVTKSEQAARAAIGRYHLGIDDNALRADLLHEKKFDFTQTRTYNVIREAYRNAAHADAAFAVMPGIELKSGKIKSHMTTAIYAQRVERRYGKCMKLAAAITQNPAMRAQTQAKGWTWPKFWPD
ncbi:MAG: DUF1615 family protein [Hyphomicrobiales bacterium]|nr:DUF1615 family protein [Hyphomicrobiales bacterium]